MPAPMSEPVTPRPHVSAPPGPPQADVTGFLALKIRRLRGGKMPVDLEGVGLTESVVATGLYALATAYRKVVAETGLDLSDDEAIAQLPALARKGFALAARPDAHLKIEHQPLAGAREGDRT